MAHHKSALKRIKQNEKRRLRNRNAKGAVRTAIKKVRADLATGDVASAKEKLVEAVRLLNRAAGKRIVPKKRASRLTSRLAKALNRAE